MSLPHFFLEHQVLSKETESPFELHLAADDIKHARVLRLAAGEHVAVVDANSDYFECEVVSFEDKSLKVSIAQHLDAPSRPSVVLVQGLAKGDKMDTIVRHATEVGIEEFVPLICSRSVVKLDKKKACSKVDRWKLIAKSASMQSGRSSMPRVSAPLSVADAVAYLRDVDALIVCWEEADLTEDLSRALCDLPLSNKQRPVRIAVVVGPEGGLTRDEVDMFLKGHDHASMVTLGPTILRTETAGIVAPALVFYELERQV